MATEFRIVCTHFGTTDHRSHAYNKRDLKKAVQAVQDADHHAEVNPGSYYSREAPYQIQSREVGEWGEHDGGSL